MSVATEFPPIVHIPERARRTSVPTAAGREGVRALDRRHLQVVPSRETQSGSVQLDDLGRQDEKFGRAQLRDRRRADWGVDVAASALLAPRAIPVRLTRRGYLATALLVCVIAGSLLMLAHASAGATPRAVPAVPSVVTVHSGDTLWSIARSVAPHRDPRAEVDELVSVNHLSSVTLTPGQTLRVS